MNRVGDRFFDQLARNGHDRRLEDLELIAGLGIRTLRYPVLWERTAPDGIARADWSWADERLERVRELGIRPIVGLVHHGSGPRGTSLLDPSFPERLAEFAAAVAERYPWVDAYTPVNEPVTTARFSTLYGHWYPHVRDDLGFATAVVTQCRAVALAMAAIREHAPSAQLVQTEDVSRIHSTPRLRYQAEFENERRWLSLDLLTGSLDPDGLLWRWLEHVGVPERELAWSREAPCPPDLVGLDYYLTGERFLDERIERYPAESHGGNHEEPYADVEAVRVLSAGVEGPAAHLLAASRRYGLPVAITEAHNGCTREEQLRWLRDVWSGALEARERGADVRAVTLWALFGSAGWDTLCREGGTYEPGAFDVRAPRPRPTALAALAAALAGGRGFESPAMAGAGWWNRPSRLLYPEGDGAPRPPRSNGSRRVLLVAGAAGTLGSAFARICERRGLGCALVPRAEMDVADAGSVRAAVERVHPWALVNAAGYVSVDDAEIEEAVCLRANRDGAATLAIACAEAAIPLLTFSTDLVFDGSKLEAYVEDDSAAPLNVYGRSKAEAELLVAQLCPDALIVRTSAFFGPWDPYNFVTATLEQLAAGRSVRADAETVVSPTFVPHLVDAALDLLIDGEGGIWHLAAEGALTWAELARRSASAVGLSDRGLLPTARDEMGYRARRPANSALTSVRGRLMPTLDESVAAYANLVSR